MCLVGNIPVGNINVAIGRIPYQCSEYQHIAYLGPIYVSNYGACTLRRWSCSLDQALQFHLSRLFISQSGKIYNVVQLLVHTSPLRTGTGCKRKSRTGRTTETGCSTGGGREGEGKSCEEDLQMRDSPKISRSATDWGVSVCTA